MKQLHGIITMLNTYAIIPLTRFRSEISPREKILSACVKGHLFAVTHDFSGRGVAKEPLEVKGRFCLYPHDGLKRDYNNC